MTSSARAPGDPCGSSRLSRCSPEPELTLGPRLGRSFYARPTLEVARELLGKTLVHRSPQGVRAVRLVEVEAYLGRRDPASHAFRGQTMRNAPMFGRAGHSYVYLIYGMYWCLNVVTEWPGSPGAVLLRGGEPLAGLPDDPTSLAGPGKLARSLGVTGAHTALDIVRGSVLSIHDAPAVPPHAMARTPRLGLNAGPTLEKPWRFVVRGSPGVSHQARSGFAATSRRAPGSRRKTQSAAGPGKE